MRISPSLAIVGSGQFGLSSRFDCHLYAVQAPEGVVLFDAGSGLKHDVVLAHLRNEFADLSRGAIVVTHAHPDHVCGLAALAGALGWPVYASAQAKQIIESGDEAAAGLVVTRAMGGYPPDLRLAPCSIEGIYEDGVPLHLCGLSLTPIAVRGHSPDSFVFLCQLDGLRTLFSADVVFYGGVLGLINVDGSDLAGYRADLPKLAPLSVEALLPAHGLFTLRFGQRHIDTALTQLAKGFVPRMVGQGDLIL